MRGQERSQLLHRRWQINGGKSYYFATGLAGETVCAGLKKFLVKYVTPATSAPCQTAAHVILKLPAFIDDSITDAIAPPTAIISPFTRSRQSREKIEEVVIVLKF
jgi:hypothetical protein